MGENKIGAKVKVKNLNEYLQLVEQLNDTIEKLQSFKFEIETTQP